MIFVFFCLNSFIQCDNLQVHSCRQRWRYFTRFSGQYSVLHVHRICSAHPAVSRHQGCFRGSAPACGAAVNIGGGGYIFSDYGFLWTCAQVWDCQTIWQLYFQLLKETPQWLHAFTFPPAVQEGAFFSTHFSTLIVNLFTKQKQTHKHRNKNF